MKLILSSDGLSNLKLRKTFINMLAKNPKEVSVLIIAGILKKRHLKYINKTKKQLAKIGIYKTRVANISRAIKAKDFRGFDVIFFMGGNTFYLLDRARKTGFISLIKEHVSKGRIYLGISAGSIIVHRTIEYAGWGRGADLNLIGLQDLRGAGLTNIAIFPHYKKKYKDEIALFRKNSTYPIKEIRDGEAVIIDNLKIKSVKK